jgi:thiosulfate/3-mercaptopyruvate sulfurtransferase
MRYTTIISTTELFRNLDNPKWVIIDARFSLSDASIGKVKYLEGHISGAVYVHLEEDLSGPVIKGSTGRHPLPDEERVREVFSKWGIPPDGQVVVYDDMGGALAAVRVWWMLRWFGFEAAAVLDGGWQAWQKSGFPVRKGMETRSVVPFIGKPRADLVVSTQQVESIRLDPSWRLLDARSADRFRGENETIDPVAGHIPGAISAPYARNLNPDGTFRNVASLRAYYKRIIGGVPPERVVVYCGSGVTSIHDILAMLHAGLGEARLYAGSWSEWITDPARLVEK